MKKLSSALLAVSFLLLLNGIVRADDVSDKRTDIVTYKFKGSSNTALSLNSIGQLTMQDGLSSVHEHWDSPPQHSTISVANVVITTISLAAAPTTFANHSITQPVYPVVLVLTSISTGAASSSMSTISTATITGINARGKSVTETIYCSSTPALSRNAYAKVSSVTFSSINSFITTEVSTARMYLQIGSTATYGLSFDTQVSSDVYKFKAFSVDSTSFTVNTEYDTISFTNPNTGVSTFDAWGRNTTSAPPRPK